jgi:hypothetical protein
MIKVRSVVLLFVLTALACDDGGNPSNGNPAGTGGMFAAGTGGAAGMAVAGISGGAGMVAGGGGDVGGSGGDMGGSGGTAGMGQPCIAPLGGDPQPTFTWFFENVVPNCAGPLCHSSAAGGGLVLDTKDDAYAQLMMPAMGVNLGPSQSMTNCEDTGLTRVVPSNPDASLLYAKLRTDIDPPCGNRMPTGSELCATSIEAIRMWIASGAQNN